MFKNILPNEANLQSTQSTSYSKKSGSRSFSTAVLAGAARVKTSLLKRRHFKN